MTLEQFMPAFTGMCEVWDKKPSKELTDIYFQALGHLTPEQWSKAVSAVMLSHEYGFPKPAHILSALGIGKDDDAQAMLAIEKIKQAIRDHGHYQSVVFDDPIIHMLIDHHDNGWPGLCAMTIEEHKWLWKDWIKLYKAYMTHPVSYSKRLIGAVEGQDTGFELAPWQKAQMISYVGDKNKCLQIEGEQIKKIGGE
jgi:hypothetical protein